MTTVEERCWTPSASIASLQFRARVLASIRAFLTARGCWEVTTPVLAPVTATDPQIESIAVPRQGRSWWLQTSPEFHMKRLLAAGSGAIFQIGPAFRQDEQGRWHNPEFTLLEWYRPGWDHHQLMDELATLWRELSGREDPVACLRYDDLVARHLDLDPQRLEGVALRRRLEARLGSSLPPELDQDGLLDAAMGLLIGPGLGHDAPCFVHAYPASQAALARLDADGRACRFEMYWQGLELANGFFELTDAVEQRRRFEQDRALRQQRGLSVPAMDEALLEALTRGLPDCAGVALGLDRLVALLAGESALGKVLAFPQDRA